MTIILIGMLLIFVPAILWTGWYWYKEDQRVLKATDQMLKGLLKATEEELAKPPEPSSSSPSSTAAEPRWVLSGIIPYEAPSPWALTPDELQKVRQIPQVVPWCALTPEEKASFPGLPARRPTASVGPRGSAPGPPQKDVCPACGHVLLS